LIVQFVALWPISSRIIAQDGKQLTPWLPHVCHDGDKTREALPFPQQPGTVKAGAVMDQQQQPQVMGKQTPGVVPHMQKTVLVVEDNELNMKLFNDLLEAHGYRVVQTRDGLSALDIARANMPDLILMDIQLPEVSGIEVTKWLKEDDELRSIPVIAVTAFAMKGDEQKIREGGCEAYISKPISVVSFLQTIDGFLKAKQ
jgi:two-component system, cell cycle response regulator DivK